MSRASIGAINAIEYDRISDRSKGFLVETQSTAESITSMLATISCQYQQGTRLTVRVPLSEDVSPHIAWCVRMPWKGHSEFACEAMLPVHRRGLGAIAYFGANTADRRSSAAIRSHEWTLLEKTRHGLHDAPLRMLAAGFRTDIIKRLSEDDLCRLEEIYRASFQSYGADLSRDAIEAMAHENITAVVRDPNHQIVAICQAEVAPVVISGKAWRLIELSETATHPASRSNGFSQVCKSALINALRGSDAVIYCESRANHGAVLRSNQRVGFHPCGRLERHCLMDSSAREFSQESAYANLFVFALP